MAKKEMKADAQYAKYISSTVDNLKKIYGSKCKNLEAKAKVLIEKYGPEIACEVTREVISDDTNFWARYDKLVGSDHPAGNKTPAKATERLDYIINNNYSWEKMADYIDMSYDEFRDKSQAGRDYCDKNKKSLGSMIASQNKMNQKVDAKKSQNKMNTRVSSKAPSFKCKNMNESLAQECLKVLSSVENSDCNLYICNAGNLTCIGTTYQYCDYAYKTANFSKSEEDLIAIADTTARASSSAKYSIDGKDWSKTVSGGKKRKWSRLQTIFPEGGQEFYLKDTVDGVEHTLKLRRIAGMGFDLLEVDGKKVPNVSKEQGKAINLAVLDAKYSAVMNDMKAVWGQIDETTKAWALYLNYTSPDGNYKNFIDELKTKYPNSTTKAPAKSTTSKKGGSKSTSIDDGVDEILGKHLKERCGNTGRVFNLNKDGFGR